MIPPLRAETTLTKHFFSSLSYVCYGYNFKISEVYLGFGMSVFYGKKTPCQEVTSIRRVSVQLSAGTVRMCLFTKREHIKFLVLFFSVIIIRRQNRHTGQNDFSISFS